MSYYGAERERTFKAYNLADYDPSRVTGLYNIPTLEAEHHIPSKLIAFNKMLSEKDNITLIKTDISPDNESIIKDDITNPNLELYNDVDIIYSIRPPSELQPYLVKLAEKIDAMLIIKPLTGEELNTPRVKMKLKNFKKASFYILR